MREPLTEGAGLTSCFPLLIPTVSSRAQILLKRSLAEYLQQLLDEKGLERSKVVRDAGLKRYIRLSDFQGGTRKASRDKVLQLAFAMHLGLRETDPPSAGGRSK